MPDNRQFIAITLACVAVQCFATACRQEEDPTDGDGPVTHPKVEDLLIFPDELRVADASVNEFIERAMLDCATGDYGKFRLLWSARQDPLPRGKYEEGWQAVREIKIRAVKQVILAPEMDAELTEGGTAYAVLADVSLDPTLRAGQNEPHREAVLLIVREHEVWRLAEAPRALRGWIRQKASPQGDAVDSVEPAPASPEKPD